MDIQFPVIVAYNIQDKKIGCALVQPLLGATLSGGQVSFYFDTIYWELNPSKCQLYKINDQQEFDLMIQVTKDCHENKEAVSQALSGSNKNYLQDVCKIGRGAECCKFLVAGSAGFQCAKNSPEIAAYVKKHWGSNPHSAQGDNCEGVANAVLNTK